MAGYIILAKFFFCMVVDQDGVEVHKLAKRIYILIFKVNNLFSFFHCGVF